MINGLILKSSEYPMKNLQLFLAEEIFLCKNILSISTSFKKQVFYSGEFHVFQFQYHQAS